MPRVKGHRAEMAHCGPESLEQARQAAFDCLVSDIRMPGMNGVETYPATKVHQPNLPTVVMTAYSADSLVQEGSGQLSERQPTCCLSRVQAKRAMRASTFVRNIIMEDSDETRYTGVHT